MFKFLSGCDSQRCPLVQPDLNFPPGPDAAKSLARSDRIKKVFENETGFDITGFKNGEVHRGESLRRNGKLLSEFTRADIARIAEM